MGTARSRIEVDLGAVRRNVAAVRDAVGPDCLIMSVVKKNAYGHGLVPVAKECVAAGSERLAVEHVESAAPLRAAGVQADVHLLSPPLAAETDDCVKLGVIPAVTDIEIARALNESAAKTGTSVKVHILVDTGMGRFGPFPEDAVDLFVETAALEHIDLEGAFTHFHSSHDADKCRAQLEAFLSLAERVRGKGIELPILHAAACGAVWRMPETHLDTVRVGLCIPGIYNDGGMADLVALHPAMKVTSAVTFVKEVPEGRPVSYSESHITTRPTVVATIPFGYGDGYHFALSGRGWVSIRGKKAPVLGRVTMDYLMVDVTDIPGVRPGTEAVLLGAPGPGVEELADLACVVPHEIVCHIGQRAPRDIVYTWQEQAFGTDPNEF